MVELSAAGANGDSGGPILNSRGELAGVLFGTAFGRTTGSYCGRVRWFLASVEGDFRNLSTRVMLADRSRRTARPSRQLRPASHRRRPSRGNPSPALPPTPHRRLQSQRPRRRLQRCRFRRCPRLRPLRKPRRRPIAIPRQASPAGLFAFPAPSPRLRLPPRFDERPDQDDSRLDRRRRVLYHAMRLLGTAVG